MKVSSLKLASVLASGILASAVAAPALAGAAFANPVIPGNLVFPVGPLTMDTLAPHDGVIPAILVFDKVFYNFGYVTGGTSMPTANHVSVTPKITVAPPAWGLEFVAAFADTNDPGASDALITYEVAVVDPTVALITDAHIQGDPNVIGSGFMIVTETWTPDVSNSLIRVYDLEPGHNIFLNDSVSFATPTSHLFVQKDIQAFAVNGLSEMSFVDQTYTQGEGTGRTPEPASLAVLGVGAAGLLARKRRA